MTKTACVTGASGYIGSHVARELLERGHTVRATVRDGSDAKKTAHLTRLAQGLPGVLELHGADLSRPGSYDPIVAGCRHVHHVASAVYLNAKDPQFEIVDPALQGTENVLGAVERARTVEAVAVTSSLAAIADAAQRPGHTYTEADWSRDADLAGSPDNLWKAVPRASDMVPLRWRMVSATGLRCQTGFPAAYRGAAAGPPGRMKTDARFGAAKTHPAGSGLPRGHSLVRLPPALAPGGAHDRRDRRHRLRFLGWRGAQGR
jgi:uncharacterized protein YbjT (DUF2867 family)